MSLDTFEGHPYVSIRVWQRGEGGAMWPLREKGCSVRLAEANGVAEALLEATELARPPAEVPSRKQQSGPAAKPAKSSKGKRGRKPRDTVEAAKVEAPSTPAPGVWLPDPSLTGAEWM